MTNERKTNKLTDTSSAEVLSYNDASGAKKIITGGVFLKPINLGTSFTTNANIARKIGKGITVAIYAIGGDGVVTIGSSIINASASTRFICEADVGGALGGKYLLISSPTVNYYIWFNTGASVDPTVGGATGIEIPIAPDDPAITIADAIRTVILATLSSIFTTNAAGSADLIINAVATGVPNASAGLGDSGWTDLEEDNADAGSIMLDTAFVRIPIKQDTWLYINTYSQEYIVTNSNCLSYLLEDSTYIQD